jgi:hypothetical protein
MAFFLRSLLFILCPLLMMSAQEAPSRDLQSDLLRDLMIVDYWNCKLNDRLPVTYDHLLQGGYINMPSARMGDDGELGLGYSHVPPYINYNLRVQLTSHLEISGNYRIFKGVEDPILSPLGFGDLSDKGANVKYALFLPEDSGYALPGISLGYEDFIGTQNFKAYYIVATHVFLDYNMEISLGYGWSRIKGVFGGLSWFPFRQCSWTYLQGLSLAAEYDATPYKNSNIELHPKGRSQKIPFNFGLKYRLWDAFDFSLSYVRGEKWAFSGSAFYNFGYTTGFLPKIDDPLPYQSPINTQPLGIIRPEDAMVQDLVYPFEEQGFDMLQVWLSFDEFKQKILRLRIVNNNCRMEEEVRDRLNHLVSALIPEDIDEVIVMIECEGFPIQEYHFHMAYVRLYSMCEIGVHELNILTPLMEVTYPDPCNSALLFKDHRDFWNLELLPKTNTLFGSSKGKFKYSLGLHVGINGFFYPDLYYSVLLGVNMFNNLENLTGIDRLNPSKLINVRTDVVEYFKHRGISVDEAYIQKSWNLGCAWYTRIAAGLFEEVYGGAAFEVLYYPIHSCWAFGAETAYLRKRNYTGIWFSDRVRKLDGYQPFYKKFIGKQYFLNLYYNLCCCNLDIRIKAGKFLANDWGARFELSRYFPSGLRLNAWYTWTNAHDRINGKTYHDKGICFSMPLDIFYTHSERDRFGEGISAWLRDIGVIGGTGQNLYDMISNQRE